MSPARVYPPHAETRVHVLEPLYPPVCASDDGANGSGEAAPALDPAWQEAYQKGFDEALRQAGQTLLRAAQALAGAATRLQEEQKASQEGVKRDVLRLSLAIARQIVMGELRANPDAIGEIVSRLLDEAEGRRVLSIRLHPDDAERLKQTPAAALLQKAKVAVQTSQEVEPGGCLLETGFGRLDARLETRFGEIAARLLGEDRETGGALEAGAAGSGEVEATS
jgi:flagellar assembly protein FliH